MAAPGFASKHEVKMFRELGHQDCLMGGSKSLAVFKAMNDFLSGSSQHVNSRRRARHDCPSLFG